MEIGDQVQILPHKVPGTNSDSVFGGYTGEITRIETDPAYVLVQCGVEMLNYDIWVRTEYVVPS